MVFYLYEQLYLYSTLINNNYYCLQIIAEYFFDGLFLNFSLEINNDLISDLLSYNIILTQTHSVFKNYDW